jgi:hypothetical protein
MLLKPELHAKNKVTEIGAFALPVLRYTFGIIIWRLVEITKIDRKNRKVLIIYKMHHPKPDIEKERRRKCLLTQ